MTPEDKTEVLQYLEKFNGIFHDMTKDVIQRILQNQMMPATSPLGDTTVKPASAPSIRINPEHFMKQQVLFLERQQALWQNMSRIMLGEEVNPVIVEPKGDQRFKDRDWNSNPVFSYIKQAYLLNADYLQQMVDSFEYDDRKTEEQVRFYTRQFVNSLAPSNYILTNPEVCREILATEGENLARGMDNFIRDLENSPAEAFKVTQVSMDAFTLGSDLANTPGEVIYQNRLVQLIQYAPTTESVYQIPLFIIPPFINKYYILDLGEEKSLVRWLVAKGYTVFLVSWVNPDESHADVSFEDYVREGVLAPLDVVENVSRGSKINMVGYCVGGTLLGIVQAYLAEKGDTRINSLSFLTTLFDFSLPGEVGNYISEQMYPVIEKAVVSKGYLDGRILALSFSLLRENNLFWSFFIENYLKGKDPIPFDILYWNSDSTNVPANAYLYYLRNMYLENRLVEPGGIAIDGVPIDLGKITVPSYSLAAMGDHIVLWQAAYKSARCLGGERRFVLTESGHVAGVVNPGGESEGGGKYPQWVNEAQVEDPDEWLTGAKQVKGSWWHDWHRWLSEKSGEQRKPRKPGNSRYKPIETAPGHFVKVRLEQSPGEPKPDVKASGP